MFQLLFAVYLQAQYQLWQEFGRAQGGVWDVMTDQYPLQDEE